MFWRRLAISALITTLMACSGQPTTTEPTLDSLKDTSIHIEKSSSVKADVSKAIDTYEDLATHSDDTQMNAKAMHRLAELEMQQIERQLEQTDTGRVEAKSYDKAISWYQKLLATYPDYAERENVLYQLARAYEHSGRTDKAIRALKILARDYPKSERATEASFRRAEILFNQQQFRDAELAYASVITINRNSQFYEQSLFKYGWSIYKQDRCNDSLDPFFALLDLKLNRNIMPSEIESLDFLSRADKELINETFRVINLCMAQQRGAITLTEYLRNKPPRIYEFLLYSSLAEYYLNQELPVESAKTYSAFTDRAPWHPYAVAFQDSAIKVYREKSLPDLVIPAKREFVRRYNALFDYWDKHIHNNYFEHLVRIDEKAKTLIRSQLRTHMADLAEYHHAKAQKSKIVLDYQEAVSWYRAYLKNFPDGESAPRINFLLAEALFEDKLYAEAAREYERTAYDYPEHPQSAEAGYAALVSYNEQEKLLKDEEKTTWHQGALQSALAFSRTFPRDARTPKVLVKAANELYQARRYEEAVIAAQTVLDRYPKASDETKRTALTVLAHTQFEEDHYEVAELFYTELKALLKPGDEMFKEVEERLAACIYKQAEHFRAQGALTSAIAQFNRLIQTTPNSSVRPMAEFDIATTYIILDDWEKAADSLEAFKKKFPDHQLRGSAEEKLAVAYVRLAKHAEAAKALVGLAKKDENPETRREAIWQAAELYEKSNDLLQASVTYVQYADQFPSPLEPAIEALNRAGKLYLKQGKDYYYLVQLEKIYVADHDGGNERTNRTRFLAAQAAFELAEPHFKRYEDVRLVEPLRKNMELKRELMKQTLEAYNKVSDIGVAEYTTAATFRIADMYADFSHKLMESDRPKNLNDEEMEQYNLMLEEQAFPFEEKAIGLHQTNTDRIAGGLYNDWTRKSLAALAKLAPARYGKMERYEAAINTIR